MKNYWKYDIREIESRLEKYPDLLHAFRCIYAVLFFAVVWGFFWLLSSQWWWLAVIIYITISALIIGSAAGR